MSRSLVGGIGGGGVKLRDFFRLAKRARLGHGFGRAVEHNLATTHTLVAALLAHLLMDVDGQNDVEFAADFDQRINVLFGGDVIQSRTNAWTQESIFHFLAHHKIVAAHFSKQEQARGDFAVAKQRGARHGVVPISIGAAKWKQRREAVGIHAAHGDARSKREGQPNQAAHFLPEPIACAQAANESLGALGHGPLDNHRRA